MTPKTNNKFELTNSNIENGLVPESVPDEFGNFGENPETYINVLTGDLMIIWWEVNRPSGDGWVRVSRKCYDLHSR